MKIRAKGDSHNQEPISENFQQQKYLLAFLKVPVCIACIYLAIPPPGMKTVSPSSPVPRPEEDTRDVLNKFESSNNLKMLFDNLTKKAAWAVQVKFFLVHLFAWKKF
jgi:hypothetical protein